MPFICENVTNAPLYKKAATGFTKDHVKIKPLSRPRTCLGNELVLKSCFMPVSYRKDADVIHQFAVYETDVWILGLPKSGTACVQQMVLHLLNDCDYASHAERPIYERSPLIEESAIRHPKLQRSLKTSMEIARRLPNPRVLKSHLPVALLPMHLWKGNARIVYVARNPLDVAREYHQEYVLTHGYQGNIGDFVELLMGDSVMYAPFNSHVTEFWAMRDEPNILFASYDQDIVTDPAKFVRRIADFLDKPISNEQANEVADRSMPIMTASVSQADIELTDKLYKRVRRGDATVNSKDANLTDLEMIQFNEWITDSLMHTDFRFTA